jgi:uncharacterized membrane protein YhaH (DUF805 family)
MRTDMRQYFYSNKGIKQGPFTLEELAAWPTAKEIVPETLIWFQGVSDWTPASKLLEFHSMLGIPVPEIEHAPPDPQKGFMGKLFGGGQANSDNSYSKELASDTEDFGTTIPIQVLDEESSENHLPPPIPESAKEPSKAVPKSWTKRVLFFILMSIKSTYKKSFTLQGRTSVLEFWSFQLFYWLVTLLLILKGMSEADKSMSEGEIPYVLALGLFVIGSISAQFSLLVRRLHDLGWSGWWLLLNWIPVVGTLIAIVTYCFPGTDGPNKYDAKKKWYEDSFSEDST